MKNYFILYFFVFLFLAEIKSYQQKKLRKNILIIIFPGGQYKNIDMKTLFDFSLNNSEEEEEYDYYYDIILHLSERKLWEQNLKNDKNKDKYSLFAYGIISDGIEKYDIDDLPKQNLFKFYQLKLRLYNQDFLDSDIILTLKKSKIKYSLLITDRPNYISILCAKELLIRNKMYLSIRPLPQLFYQEKKFINPGFIPTLGSEFTNILTFKERCSNFYNFYTDKLLNFLSNYEIKYLYNVYDYSYINTNNYFNENAIILIQYPNILTYPLLFPPHIIPLNSISLPYNNYDNSKNEDKFNSSKINDFINKYKNNIVLSKDIFHQLEYNTVKNLIMKMNNIGFIYIYEFEEKKLKNEMKNLFVLDYKKFEINSYKEVLYYLLDKNNIGGIITNSNFNEIVISVYFSKPVVSFGTGIYQQNINSYIKKNSIGVIINKDNINNHLYFNEAIKKIINENDDEIEGISNIYIKQSQKLSKLLKITNNQHPGEEYTKWLNYGMKNDYEDLKITFYEKNNWIINNNFDIIIISLIIIFIFFFIIIIFCKNIFYYCCCHKSSSNKRKIDNKKTKKD